MPTILGNIYRTPEGQRNEEAFETLLDSRHVRLERIVSTGHQTPEGEWYDSDEDEWVVLLTGKARLRFDDTEEAIALVPGDYMNIPAHRRHRVEWTEPEGSTIWLALHYKA